MKVEVRKYCNNLCVSVANSDEVYKQLSFYQWEDGNAHVLFFVDDKFLIDKILPMQKAIEAYNGLLNKHFKNTP